MGGRRRRGVGAKGRRALACTTQGDEDPSAVQCRSGEAETLVVRGKTLCLVARCSKGLGHLGYVHTAERLEPFSQVACGRSHAVVMTDGGVALTWGEGREGQLGQGDEMFRREPTRVAGLPM